MRTRHRGGQRPGPVGRCGCVVVVGLGGGRDAVWGTRCRPSTTKSTGSSYRSTTLRSGRLLPRRRPHSSRPGRVVEGVRHLYRDRWRPGSHHVARGSHPAERATGQECRGAAAEHERPVDRHWTQGRAGSFPPTLSGGRAMHPGLRQGGHGVRRQREVPAADADRSVRAADASVASSLPASSAGGNARQPSPRTRTGSPSPARRCLSVWGTAGKWAGRDGVAVGFATGAWDQWSRDGTTRASTRPPRSAAPPGAAA